MTWQLMGMATEHSAANSSNVSDTTLLPTVFINFRAMIPSKKPRTIHGFKMLKGNTEKIYSSQSHTAASGTHRTYSSSAQASSASSEYKDLQSELCQHCLEGSPRRWVRNGVALFFCSWFLEISQTLAYLKAIRENKTKQKTGQCNIAESLATGHLLSELTFHTIFGQSCYCPTETAPFFLLFLRRICNQMFAKAMPKTKGRENKNVFLEGKVRVKVGHPLSERLKVWELLQWGINLARLWVLTANSVYILFFSVCGRWNQHGIRKATKQELN